jgi:hypothetical protein
MNILLPTLEPDSTAFQGIKDHECPFSVDELGGRGMEGEVVGLGLGDGGETSEDIGVRTKERKKSIKSCLIKNVQKGRTTGLPVIAILEL